MSLHPSWRRLIALIAAIGLGCAGNTTFAGDGHWVGTWGASPQLTEPANLPPSPGLSNNTLRQIVHVSIGGNHLRVRFSNAYGTGPVTMQAVHLAASTGDDSIATQTDTALTFRGVPSVTIAPGSVVTSDPIEYALSPLANVAVSIYFGVTSSDVTGHPGSRATSYIHPNNAVSAPSLPAAVSTEHWYILTGIDVIADSPSATIVALGDSITDGRGSGTDANGRWPDRLYRRMYVANPTGVVAVINQGIGGNAVVSGGLGPPAVDRFDRDVLGQSGVRWLIVLEGVNDIGLSGSSLVATNIIAAYEQFIGKAHANDILVYGGTITPFGGSFYDSPDHETSRQTVNAWIRTSAQFDAVIDFDAAIRDPAIPTQLLPLYDSGDKLHPGPRGYRAMADAIDLLLFAP